MKRLADGAASGSGAREHFARFVERGGGGEIHLAHDDGVGQAALLAEVDHLLFDVGKRTGFAGCNDEVGRSRLAAGKARMTVRFGIAANGFAGAEEIFQNAFFDQLQSLVRNAFVVHFLFAEEVFRGVVGDVEGFRHDANAAASFEFSGCRLAGRAGSRHRFAGDVEIAAEDFGHELRAGLAFEQDGAGVVLAGGGGRDLRDLRADFAGGFGQVGLGEHLRGVVGVEDGPVAHDHAVRRLGGGANLHGTHGFALADLGALGVDEAVQAVDGGVLDQRGAKSREVVENRGNFAGAVVPGLVVEAEGFPVFDQRVFRGGREVGQLLVDGDAAEGGAFAGDLLQGAFVGGIGGEPEVLADHQGIVFEREVAQVIARAASASAACVVGVVEFVVADADVDLGDPEIGRAGGDEAAVGRSGGEGAALVDSVAHEIGLFELVEGERGGAFQFGAHGVEHGVGLRRERGQAGQAGEEGGYEGGGKAGGFQLVSPLAPSAFALRGEGSSGGRSWPESFFSISISEIRMAGETAETGTLPDSAPQ